MTYKHSDEDLIYVKNAWKNKYSYEYDELHNLTHIHFPDGTFKALSYNKRKDWVTSFTGRDKCTEVYKYKIDAPPHTRRYTSHLEKKCKGQVTDVSSYEFIHKEKKDGSRYLASIRSDENSDVTKTHYHQTFGKPTSIFKNGVKTVFQYNKSGLIRKRSTPLTTSTFQYKNSCQKVSKVVTRYYQGPLPPHRKTSASRKTERKLVKAQSSDFIYKQPQCHLTSAKNSSGQAVRISHDHRGRIQTIKDQEKRTIRISYNEHFDKPSSVTQVGLGTIHVSYRSDGSIKNVRSKGGPNVALQVASAFNNLLGVISPAVSGIDLRL